MGVTDYQYILIGGSTKCGTTSIFSYLNDHPSVCGSRIKESRFFWNNKYTLPSTGVSHLNGIKEFDDLFDCKKPTTHRVEATPDYLYDVESAKLIHQYLPKTLMVFILREPISRLQSWYKFAKQLNLFDANYTFGQYVDDQLKSDNSTKLQHMRALEQGRYSTYLESFTSIFGAENILVLHYKELSDNPLSLMQKICKRANLDASFYDEYDFKVLNKSINVKDPEKFNRYRNFRRGLRQKLKSMPNILGTLFKAVIKPFDKAYINMTSNDWENINMDKELIQRLEKYYEAESIFLKSMMNQ